MNQETMKRLKDYNINHDQEIKLNEKYERFSNHLSPILSGEGMVGEKNYLIIWDKDQIEELNNAYETYEFLHNVILIGSDGGDMAYGINGYGEFIRVPFIGMSDDEVEIIAADFDSFIKEIYYL